MMAALLVAPVVPPSVVHCRIGASASSSSSSSSSSSCVRCVGRSPAPRLVLARGLGPAGASFFAPLPAGRRRRRRRPPPSRCPPLACSAAAAGEAAFPQEAVPSTADDQQASIETEDATQRSVLAPFGALGPLGRLIGNIDQWLGLRERRRLQALEAAANTAPTDASKQFDLYRALNKRKDSIKVVEHFESHPEHAVNTASAVEYLRALVATNSIDRFIPSRKNNATDTSPAFQELLADLQQRSGGDASQLQAQAFGVTDRRPLHVILVDKNGSSGPLRVLKEVLGTMLVFACMYAAWLFGIEALRKYASGVAGVSTSSSVQSASSYAPKEYNKDSMLEKGILLTGAPGTGKTLLAKVGCATGSRQAGCISYDHNHIALFVGVGSRRVRALFAAAKKKAPCIVFIDEIDAVGGSRKYWESHTRKTLNQLLVEMDGFEANEGIIVLAATNLPETLDPALTRPGRFDRTIAVPTPDVKGRLEIIKHYLKDKPVSADVSPEVLARGTTGFSGADLANLINVAAVKAALENSDSLSNFHLDFAKDRILMGTERKSAQVSEESRKLTAYHESGHTLVALNTAGAIPVHKATIVPRGSSLGMMVQLPDKDETSVSMRQLLARLDVAMGGRVAEELIFGADQVSTGAQSDLKAATAIARHMVTQCGMSDLIGPVYVADTASHKAGLETQKTIDAEVRRLLREAYVRVQKLLAKHEKDLHLLAGSLLEHETLTADEIRTILELGPKALDKSLEKAML
eukprot:jgi/Chlat1/7718/Chrsp66S00564